MEWMTGEYAYLYMFWMGFLAATVLPIASEWLVIALVAKGADPLLVLTSATFGNYAGACTTYLIGIFGSDFAIKRVLKISDESRGRAERLYEKYGSLSLLLSWVPIVGDPLCLIGGLLKVNFIKYSILVFIGKLARYSILVFVINKAVQ
jgi:membrane protein YqaA with SNARE-associated domain